MRDHNRARGSACALRGRQPWQGRQRFVEVDSKAGSARACSVRYCDVVPLALGSLTDPAPSEELGKKSRGFSTPELNPSRWPTAPCWR